MWLVIPSLPFAYFPPPPPFPIFLFIPCSRLAAGFFIHACIWRLVFFYIHARIWRLVFLLYPCLHLAAGFLLYPCLHLAAGFLLYPCSHLAAGFFIHACIWQLVFFIHACVWRLVYLSHLAAGFPFISMVHPGPFGCFFFVLCQVSSGYNYFTTLFLVCEHYFYFNLTTLTPCFGFCSHPLHHYSLCPVEILTN